MLPVIVKIEGIIRRQDAVAPNLGGGVLKVLILSVKGERSGI